MNFIGIRFCVISLLVSLAAGVGLPVLASEHLRQQVDYLSFAQGAVPVSLGGVAEELRIGLSHALMAIDGDVRGFVLTPKPGNAQSEVVFVYQLPALTRFSAFSVPNVLETPSPSQTFIRNIEIAGSNTSAEGPYQKLGTVTLSTHDKKGETTTFVVAGEIPVRWVRVSLSGGIDIQRDKTFLEFSEIIGHGRQDAVPLSQTFTGKWKGRGVLLELKQEDNRVSGCYDREGALEGTITGNILRATGRTTPAGIPSSFVLGTGANGEIFGVRSTNGAPFKLYQGESAQQVTTACSEKPVAPPGCGAILHGIQFDFDSARIRPESGALLDALAVGLKTAEASRITVIGHTSSEGSDTYNQGLSERRAKSVVAALVDRDLRKPIAASGQGEQDPIADNNTEAGRSLNRRVEIACD
ncbi:OmpA family protein [Oleiphilus messinensis]|uniref:OmpA family protein n=1 Tax=Oleiphilus messinensis TaxID=141451 RepID=A0A1Y0I608_9GAMM|nr:OmpA family protein [Oleiphilus messinensis]ARU55670.1 OmpA family protein [Oleiphilus messinensis]